jgi:hypothetical protein
MRRLVGASVLLAALALAPAARASFEVTGFDGAALQRDGTTSTQAGEHPFEVVTEFELTTHLDNNGNITPDANPRDIEVALPAGFSGNPTNVATCTQAQLSKTKEGRPQCPLESQIGYAVIDFALGGATVQRGKFPIYNMERPLGSPALFGFNIVALPVYVRVRIRTGGDYGVTAVMSPVSQATPVVGGEFHLWGVPADSGHDKDRGVVGGPSCVESGTGCEGTVTGAPSEAAPAPFLTNPTDCAAGPLTTALRVDSWQEIGSFRERSFLSHLTDGTPAGVDGCSRLGFHPSIEVRPTSTSADSPTGLAVDLSIPQDESPTTLAEAMLKRATVTLPEGMTVNPSAAAGLGGCTSAQADLHGSGPANCPDASKIGTVRVQTPLLDHAIEGSVFAAAQGDNPFGSLLAMYVSIDDPQTGVVVKIAGHVEADPNTGRLTAVFDDNPQVSFSSFQLDLFGGPRAVLRTPPTCGTYSTTGRFSPWSAADPDRPTPAETVTSIDSFTLSSGPNGGACPAGGFNPKLEAGTTSPVAGRYSPLSLRLVRNDGSQELRSLSLSFPPGLLAKLAGVPYCSPGAIDAALARSGEGQGALELSSPSCPAASQVGTITAGAGSGPSPFYLQAGRVYLAGPYRGAPLSLLAVVPAVAGPFDLGAVVVRDRIEIDPETAAVSAVSDPIPTILHGIPVDLRDLRVEVGRSQFVLNPTSCAEMAFGGTAGSASGATAPLSDRFQVGGCAGLAFAPRLSARLFGPTRRGAHPKLRALLSTREREANVARAAVTLPHSEFLEQAHIRTVCTRVQFAAGQCPKGSIYGSAKAWSPLLDQPLSGPVYLRSNGSERKLPDLVVALHGPATQPIEIDLIGFIDSVHGGIRIRFPSVPDAPVSKFMLSMNGGKKGLIVNSTDICKGVHKARVRLSGQNGRIERVRTPMKARCGGKGHKKRHAKHRRR